jgi:hypothetical protein
MLPACSARLQPPLISSVSPHQNVRAAVLSLLIAASLPAQAAGTDFAQSRCELSASPHRLDLRLSASDRSARNVSVSNGQVAFVGTTLSDMKWVADLKSFKELVIELPEKSSVVGMLTFVASSGSAKEMGWVTQECWQKIELAARGHVNTRVQVQRGG